MTADRFADRFIAWCDWFGRLAVVALAAFFAAALWLVGVVIASPGTVGASAFAPAAAPTFGVFAAVAGYLAVCHAIDWWRMRPWRQR